MSRSATRFCADRYVSEIRESIRVTFPSSLAHWIPRSQQCNRFREEIGGNRNMNYRQRRTAGAGAGLASLLMVGVLIFNAIPAAAVDFAHPAFKRVWDRTDSLVASLQVSRTWFWGPEPRAA